MTLEEFKNQTLNKTYGNPPPLLIPNSGSYQGQCVSYVRQYIEGVFGIKTRPWGNAIDWWNNSKVQKYFEQITDGPRKDGDLLVWGDDSGTWTGEYGHIAISYQGRLLNQNWLDSRKVTINDFFQPGYLGALRLKGGNMPTITADQVYWLYYDIAGVSLAMDDPQITARAGKDYVAVTEEIKQYFANKHQCAFDFRRTVDTQAKKIAELEEEIAQGGGDFIPAGELFIKKK